MTINVKLNWKVKDGYQAQDNDFYTVTLVEAYGVSTNTNQNFANYQHAFKYSGIQGKHLAEFAQGPVPVRVPWPLRQIMMAEFRS